MVRKTLLSLFVAMGMITGELILPMSAQAVDVTLLNCPSDSGGTQYLPASRNLGPSSSWTDAGFRSCSWIGRHGIRYTCWSDSAHWSDPTLHIVRDGTGDEWTRRQAHQMFCDGMTRYLWDAAYPSGSTTNHYHLHVRSHDQGINRDWDQINLRVS